MSCKYETENKFFLTEGANKTLSKRRIKPLSNSNDTLSMA